MFVCFLGESMARQTAFGLYLTLIKLQNGMHYKQVSLSLIQKLWRNFVGCSYENKKSQELSLSWTQVNSASGQMNVCSLKLQNSMCYKQGVSLFNPTALMKICWLQLWKLALNFKKAFLHFSAGSTRLTIYIRTVSSLKGQLISESLFDVLNFTKKQCKILMNFCPRI